LRASSKVDGPVPYEVMLVVPRRNSARRAVLIRRRHRCARIAALE
jgi:hypothetical protein